jgi:hypothetical protein
LYASWNALCCGIEAELAFDGAVAAADAVEVCISAVLSSGSRLPIAPKLTLPLGQDLHLG